MNEGNAKNRRVEEDKKLIVLEKDVPGCTQEPLNLVENTFNSDEILARVLQKQFDEEYNEMLKNAKNKFKRVSEVPYKYRRALKHTGSESESDDEDPDEKRFWDKFDILEREFNIMPTCGYRVQQHGAPTTNTCKMTNLPSDFYPDGFHSLKRHSAHEQARLHLLKDKTVEIKVSAYTRMLLYKMIDTGLLKEVNGIISIGTEAVILHADNHSNPRKTLMNECAIKVFKYIIDDYQFKNQEEKQRIRRNNRLRAEKEMHNLNRLKSAGIPCPEGIKLKRHLLVMSFIGRNRNPAPKLMDAVMDENQYNTAYEQVVNCMNIMYHQAGLIHANLSEHNILWYNDICYFIGVSVSVELGHPNASQILMNDCRNITEFFRVQGVPEVKTAEELFVDITGCDFSDDLALSALQNKFDLKPHLDDGSDSEQNKLKIKPHLDDGSGSESTNSFEDVTKWCDYQKLYT